MQLWLFKVYVILTSIIQSSVRRVFLYSTAQFETTETTNNGFDSV